MFPLCSPIMAAANASARGQRAAILESRLTEFTGYYVAVDCQSAGCGGERTFAVSTWRTSTEARPWGACSRGCGAAGVADAWAPRGW